MRALLLLTLMILLPGNVLALERARVAVPVTAPLTPACVVDAARAGGLPLAALIGILATEGGKTGEALSNTNGTWDLAGFQINTVHLNELATMGIAPETILSDGCVNAYAAAWILQKEYRRTGDIWKAIGAYHSRTPHRRDAYIRKVRKNLSRLEKSGLHTLHSFDQQVEAIP
ncbi:MAG: lytic transglycosylase domain-containing protein [Desulfovibrio sp.]|nr:lytic transglycosylase domain-containing protein [Desulfovibrio sp.]